MAEQSLEMMSFVELRAEVERLRHELEIERNTSDCLREKAEKRLHELRQAQHKFSGLQALVDDRERQLRRLIDGYRAQGELVSGLLGDLYPVELPF